MECPDEAWACGWHGCWFDFSSLMVIYYPVSFGLRMSLTLCTIRTYKFWNQPQKYKILDKDIVQRECQKYIVQRDILAWLQCNILKSTEDIIICYTNAIYGVLRIDWLSDERKS